MKASLKKENKLKGVILSTLCFVLGSKKEVFQAMFWGSYSAMDKTWASYIHAFSPLNSQSNPSTHF